MIHLEKINKKQLPIVKDLAYAIWPSAYREILSAEQLNYMLDNFYSIENLENQMDKGQVFELLFEDSNVVGFVAYELNCNETGLLKIHKIYLLPETQGKGFGKFMIDEVIKISDRIIVMFEGKIMGEISGSTPDMDKISAMMGGKEYESINN